MLSWVQRPVVLSGPSGSGKSTLLKRLFAKYPDQFGFCISHTTRSRRSGETHGKEYYFTDVANFKSMIESNQFLEWAIYAGNYYGTSLAALEQLQASSKVPILDIDLEGVKSVHRLNERVQARFIFIKTPDMDTLAMRLKQRGTETEESLKLRLETAQKEIQYAETYPETHHIVIVNEHLDTAFAHLESFLFLEPQGSHIPTNA